MPLISGRAGGSPMKIALLAAAGICVGMCLGIQEDLVVTIKLQDSWYGIHDGYFMVVATANQSALMRTQSRQL